MLAGVYWLWCLAGRATRERAGLLALVVAAPLCWALVDLAVTGDPLYSLHATSKLAEELGRVRGIGNVPRTFVTFLADVARPPVALAGVVGLALAVRRFGVARMAVPIALLGAGALTFVATGIAGLSIIQRYLTVPAVALCVLAGYAVLGFTTLEPGGWRTRWRGAAAGALVAGVVFVALKAGSFAGLRSELRFIGATHDELSAPLAQLSVRGGMRGGPLTSRPMARAGRAPDARRRGGRVRSRARTAGGVPTSTPARPPADAAMFERRFGPLTA